jgi:hypothetical protein
VSRPASALSSSVPNLAAVDEIGQRVRVEVDADLPHRVLRVVEIEFVVLHEDGFGRIAFDDHHLAQAKLLVRVAAVAAADDPAILVQGVRLPQKNR